MIVMTSLADSQLVALIMKDAVGIVPTDTIFGLVARAESQTAAARLYDIKHREGKPGTLVAANVEQLERLGIDRQYLDRVGHLWPGPVSIVLPAGQELAYLHQGLDSLAVRIPADPAMAALLTQTGPLLTSSANLPGEPQANTIQEAQAYFGDAVDFYVDGQPAGTASTVVRLNPDNTLEVLRQGTVHIKEGEIA